MSRLSDRPESVPVLIGPTGSGKSALAEAVARADPRVQLINTDAFQAYRDVDIGTAKPADRSLYLLLDCQDPGMQLDAVQFAGMVRAAIAECIAVQKMPLLVGGNGFYLQLLASPPDDPEAMVDGDTLSVLRTRIEDDASAVIAEIRTADPTAKLPHINDHYRIEKAWLRSRIRGVADAVVPRQPLDYWGLWAAGVTYEKRLRDRIGQMLAAGWQAEARAVAARYGSDAPALRAIGYKTLLQADLATDVAGEILLQTRRYAKRQRTWFRTRPVRWFPARYACAGRGAEPLQRLLQYTDVWHSRNIKP